MSLKLLYTEVHFAYIQTF